MKQYLILAAAAMTLAACSNDDDCSKKVAAQISAGLSAANTRAVDATWNADKIGVSVTGGTSYTNQQYSTTSTGTTAGFTAVGDGIFFQDTQTCTFSAYAPYQSAGGTVDVDTKNNNTSDKQESIDFLYAAEATASESSPKVSFTDNTASSGKDCSFHHKMARLQIVLQTSTADGFSASDIFDAENKVTLSGLKHTGTFDTTTGTAAVSASATAVNDWDITSCKHTDDESAYTRTYSLILLPQDASQTKLPIKITINGNTYTNDSDIKPNLEAGYSYTYTITVKKTGLTVSGCTIAAWAEGSSGNGNATM